ncbi:MAG: hypothetical protein AAGA93_04725 [Actinomycetota bacterium]
MSSAVLQFLVAGALAVAWIWMLGRPLLTMLVRRTRRDSVDHFRYQQAALGRSVGLDDDFDHLQQLARFHPIADWRAQPLHQRRLQLLLGSGLATFIASLLAIALRGTFVRLFLVMTILLTVHLLVAALIGSRELRNQEAEAAKRAAGRPASPEAAAARTATPANPPDPMPAEDDLLATNGIADGLFDDGFFEPIPELERLSEPGEPDERVRPGEEAPAAPEVDAPAAQTSAADDGSTGVAATDPTFAPAPAARTRSTRKPKARPIYIESELDEADDAGDARRAVND